ncbi:MAG: Uncharacterised protein [Flavobacteriia bacterium]|nr:MAG: Uncharacterised protein [Flavobacteriia bacterium]
MGFARMKWFLIVKLTKCIRGEQVQVGRSALNERSDVLGNHSKSKVSLKRNTRALPASQT